MALTARGARLTRQHRQEQLSIRARFLQELLRLFGLLDPARLDATTEPWLTAMVPLLRQHWQRSAAASAAYLALFLEAETGRPAPEPRLPRFTPERARAAQTSLLVTGPVKIRNLTQAGQPLASAVRVAQSTVAGAAGRHVLDGGRAVLLDPEPLDRSGVRYARVTDPDPCWFCAMMASRGYVYLSEESGGREASDRFAGPGMFKFHDYCGCTLEPTLDPDAPLPEDNARFADLWVTATRGLHTDAARRAFRRALEGRPLPGDPILAAA
ncbi:hypothetical protein JOF41_007369 [Saccharothrix coeruleofusca]|uniref:VG15 protein n=1 Tax=Saccharothrix coeruleofusca TaxID=33919 RepID=UPI001AE40EDA|nr:hypothetical protein [Saccharothrix coeruleofusca]MBP2341115.1 hypothetical protein [Saccharothrix coeruleofusca]